MDNSKPRAFICYRRTSDPNLIARIHEYLIPRLGAENVFFDRSSLRPSAKWKEKIFQFLETADAILIIIDLDWLASLNKRISQQKEDILYQEIIFALKTQMNIVPILINGSKMPEKSDLPEDLQEMCEWHAWELSLGNYFSGDMDAIIESLSVSYIHRSISNDALSSSKEIDELLIQIRNSHISPVDRLAAADRLIKLGDSRSGVGLKDGVPDIHWMPIPEGEFIYGGFYNRSAQLITHQAMFLPFYEISRYPITFIQFQSFLESQDGFQNQRWWEELGIKKPSRDVIQEWPYASYPQVRVSWYEAFAFCRWLGNKRGYEIKLPTEPQWEKAARGIFGFEYPWDHEYISGYANINETAKLREVGPYYFGYPTAVGIYPRGTSPSGVEDMCGNVWEWCLDDAEIQPNITGISLYPIRGGAFDTDYDFSKTINRQFKEPNTQDRNIGFRIVRIGPKANS